MAVKHRLNERDAMVEDVLEPRGGDGFEALLASPGRPFRLGNVSHAHQDIDQRAQRDLAVVGNHTDSACQVGLPKAARPMMAAMSTKSRHRVFALPRSTAVTIFSASTM